MDKGPARLARYVTRDRKERYPSRRAFAAASGLSPRTVTRIEQARPVSHHEQTRGLIEQALGWTVGSFERVLAGGRPGYVRDPELDELVKAWRRLSPDARQIVLRLVRDVLDS